MTRFQSLALAFVLMALVVGIIVVYVRRAGTEELV